MTHDDLARSLADHLRGPARMTWCDMQLGASGSVRPDVYTLNKSFAHPSPMSYECKVSLGDYRGDVTSGKWQTYLPYSCGVYFASEAGLITKDMVPEHCGLITLREDRWRVARKAVLRSVTIPQNALLKLIIDGVEREGPRYRVKAWSESVHLQELSTRFGEITAHAIRDRLAVEHETSYAKSSAERIIKDAQQRADDIRKEAQEKIAPLRVELCKLLGLQDDANHWALESAIRKLRQDLEIHPAQRHLQTLTQSLRNALDRDGFKASKCSGTHAGPRCADPECKQ
jgi:hypothetical protein